jgi:polyhydroxybutyrate depolymerase
MDRRHRFSGLALAVVVASAWSVACSESGSDSSETGGAAGSSGASGGMTSLAGGTAKAGTTSVGGTTSNAGVAGASGKGGTTGVGGAGTSGAGAGGVSGAGTAGTSGGSAGGGGMGGPATGGRGGSAGGGTAGLGDAGASGSSGGGTLGPSAGCGKATELESGRASIDVAGKTREYILALPDDYDPSHPYKLVFGWHPWGGSAEQIANGGYFGLENVVDGQAILVAPEGQDYQDNGLGWGNADGEDVAFLHAMLDRFNEELCIDQDRVFSTGFSFGAMFSFTLACTADSGMRAIAPMAGNATTSGRCEDGTRSVATMAFIGTDDSLLNGHRQAVQIFVERNGCDSETTPAEPSWCDGLASSFEPCSCVEYQGCDDGYPVVECEYNAGHQFAPTAGQALWDFFSQF